MVGVIDGVGVGTHSEQVTDGVTVGVTEILVVILGVTVGVMVTLGVTETVIEGVTVGVGVGDTEIDGVTLGVGFTTIFTGTLGADLAQFSLDLVLSNSVIPSFLFL